MFTFADKNIIITNINHLNFNNNVLIKELGDHSVPENWVQRPVVNTEAGSNPGAPLAWGSPENPDDAVAGYGYVPCDTSEVEETFYYHSDHLGSTAYITDQKANVTQYDAYLPYGELLVDEHSSSADLPYKFNGKELDEETGLYYYGARYMNPVTCMWYGVDPLAEKYPNVGVYVYCHGNPITLVDPDGMTDYKINNRGYLSVQKNTDDKFDRIYATNGKCISINKNITKQLLKGRAEYKSKGDQNVTRVGHYAEGAKDAKDEMVQLFSFVANNTDVEWLFNGYKTRNGEKYFLATTHSKISVKYTHGSNDEYDLMFSIHTHPGDDPVNSPQYASGYNTTKIIGSDLTVLPPFKFDDNPYGDRGTVWDTYGRIQARDIENKRVRSKYPPFYIYHIKSQNRILYNPFNKCINKTRIRKPSDLIR